MQADHCCCRSLSTETRSQVEGTRAGVEVIGRDAQILSHLLPPWFGRLCVMLWFGFNVRRIMYQRWSKWSRVMWDRHVRPPSLFLNGTRTAFLGFVCSPSQKVRPRLGRCEGAYTTLEVLGVCACGDLALPKTHRCQSRLREEAYLRTTPRLVSRLFFGSSRVSFVIQVSPLLRSTAN